MKKILYVISLCFFSIFSQAQEKQSIRESSVQEASRHYVSGENGNLMYAQLVGTSKFMSSKVTVEIDFGQERSWINMNGNNRIIDPKTGKPFVFNSMVDAMNYMGSLGWKFLQAYVVTTSNQNVYHWLLCKETDDDMSDDLPTTKKDLKK